MYLITNVRGAVVRLAFGYYVSVQGCSYVRLSTHAHIYDVVLVAHASCVGAWPVGSRLLPCRIATLELLHVLQGRFALCFVLAIQYASGWSCC